MRYLVYPRNFRRVLAAKSLPRISSMQIIFSKGDPLSIFGTYGSSREEDNGVLGMDSHADVSCAGMDALVISRLEGRTCDVKGFHDSYGSINNVNYVNVLYKYIDNQAQEYLLEVNQALDFTSSMKNSILCTNQARHNGVLVHDIPRIIDGSSPQCVSFPSHNVQLPLIMKGPVPVLPISKPNPEDLIVLPRLQLTSDDLPWLPHAIFGDETIQPQSYFESDQDYYISGVMEL